MEIRKVFVYTGILIPINTFDERLTLNHHVCIVVNGATKIGRNCCIMENVNIETNGGSSIALQLLIIVILVQKQW
jgi:serine acetyltransferase